MSDPAEEIGAFVERGDLPACVAWAETHDEATRRKAAPKMKSALLAYSKLPGLEDKTTPAQRSQGIAVSGVRDGYDWEQHGRRWRALCAALLASCTPAEMRKLRLGIQVDPETLPRILAARPVPVAQELVDWLMDNDRECHARAAVAAVVSAGIARWPDRPETLQAWLRRSWRLASSAEGAPALAAHLAGDAHFGDMWPMLFAHDWDWWGGETVASEAVACLVREGRIPRDVAIAGAVDGLARDSDARTMRSYARLVDELEPGADELSPLLATLLDLVASRNSTTQGFAVARLAAMLKSKHVEPGELLGSLGPALASDTRTVASRALILVQAAARQDASLRPRAARMAMEALRHEGPAVQESAAKAVLALGSEDDEALVSELRQVAAGTGEKARLLLASWLSDDSRVPESAPASAPSSAPASAPSSAPSFAPAVEEAIDLDDASLDPHWALVAGVEAAREALRRDAAPPALDLVAHVPRLTGKPLRPIATLEDVDELVDLLAALLEGRGSGEDFERALDGTSRLCGTTIPDFPRRTHGIRQRAVAIVRPQEWNGKPKGDPAGLEEGVRRLVERMRGIDPLAVRVSHDVDFWPRIVTLHAVEVAQLVLAWTDGRADPPRDDKPFGGLLRALGNALGLGTGRAPESLPRAIRIPREPELRELGCASQAVSRRTLEIASRVARRQAAPLLAAPTHAGGWIDPIELLERWRRWNTSGMGPGLFDMSQALLRVAPLRAGSLEAVESSGLPASEFLDALRHALGARVVPVGPTRALWLAAARARAPFGDDVVVHARHAAPWPDGSKAARIEVRVQRERGEQPVKSPRPTPWDSSMPIPTVADILERSRKKPTLVAFRLPHAPEAHGIEAGSAGLMPLDCLAVLLHSGGNASWSDPWAARVLLVAPALREAVFAGPLEQVSSDLDGTYGGSLVTLSALAEPDARLGSVGRSLIALVMGSKDQRLVASGVDAAVAAIDDGRLDAEGLAEALSIVLRTEGATPSRFVKPLAQVARESALHAMVVRGAVEKGVPWQLLGAKHALPFLELLLELGLKLGESIESESLRAWASGQSVGGRTGKLIQELLEAQRVPSAARAEGGRRALAGRVARARRWGCSGQERDLVTAAPPSAPARC